MNKPLHHLSPEAPAEPKLEAERLRSRTRRWVDLHSALSQLLEARALASSENPDPAGDFE
jgi:hypothetical protein